jgi:hypothetical protein
VIMVVTLAVTGVIMVEMVAYGMRAKALNMGAASEGRGARALKDRADAVRTKGALEGARKATSATSSTT